MRDAIIIDIDDCWMDSRKWIAEAPYPSKKEEDWNEFYKKVYVCKPNKRFIQDVLGLIEEMNLFPVFITSRSDRVKLSTIFQIENNSSLKVGDTCALYMRTKEHKYMKSGEVKDSILNEIKGMYNFIYGIDDTQENLEVFKKYGVETVIRYSIATHDYERV
jgi:hypothetical protein